LLALKLMPVVSSIIPFRAMPPPEQPMVSCTVPGPGGRGTATPKSWT